MESFFRAFSLLDDRQRRSAGVLFLLMIVGMVFETIGVGLVVPVISIMMQGSTAEPQSYLLAKLVSIKDLTQTQIVMLVMIALAAVYFVKNIFLAFLVWRQTRFAFLLQEVLSRKLLDRYLNQDYIFHLQNNSSILMRNATSEVNLFAQTVGCILVIGTEFLVVLGVSCLLIAVQPVGAILVVAILGISGGLFYRATRSKVTAWGQERQFQEGMRIKYLQEGLGGVKDSLLLGRAQYFLDKYKIHNAGSARVSCAQAVLQQMPRLWLELLAVIGLSVLVIAMIEQSSPMETIVPTLGLFAAAAFRLMPSANRLLMNFHALRYGVPAIDTLYREFTSVPSSPELKEEGADRFKGFENDIQLQNICFSYPNTETETIQDLSLSIKKGACVGLVGTSGSGKSTLVDIILGLLSPSGGRVLVDGSDINLCIRGWQNQIGYVPQSIFLSDDSLRKNVAFGLNSDSIDDAALARAITAAKLDEFVASLPAGLETQVGERGVRLSGGQRQRIGIARALYHDPSVLILDEATSALDTMTEVGIMNSIDSLRGVKTIIIVAHRLSTIEKCDWVYRLEKGRVVQEGTAAGILAVVSERDKAEN